MIEGQRIARKVNNDPPAYRISFDGVEVGSIAKRTHHIKLEELWHWGVDTMPLMDHSGRPPCGDAESFPAALQAFKAAFVEWHANIDPALWQRNRDYIAIPADQWKRE